MRILNLAVDNKEELKNLKNTIIDITKETDELNGAKLLLQNLVSRKHLKRASLEAKEKAATTPKKKHPGRH